MRRHFSLALCMLAVSGLVACGKTGEKTPPPTPVTTAAVPLITPPTQAEMISAMLRGHPNSKQVCVDGERSRSFFLDYGPLLPAGAPGDGKIHGWLLIENIDFFKTSNNTWFITDQKDDNYIQVYPDVAGLTCRSQ